MLDTRPHPPAPCGPSRWESALSCWAPSPPSLPSPWMAVGRMRPILMTRADMFCFPFAISFRADRSPWTPPPNLQKTSMPPSHPQGNSQETHSFLDFPTKTIEMLGASVCSGQEGQIGRESGVQYERYRRQALVPNLFPLSTCQTSFLGVKTRTPSESHCTMKMPQGQSHTSCSSSLTS